MDAWKQQQKSEISWDKNIPKSTNTTIPALSSKQTPRDKMNAIENIDQSANRFQLDWRELHNIDVQSLPTFVAAKLCLSRLCFPFTRAKWITKMPNKGKKEKVMFQALCVSFIFAVSALNMVVSTIWQLWQIGCSTMHALFLFLLLNIPGFQKWGEC